MSSQERAAELLKQLDSEVTALTDSDAWKRHLAMQARLHKYSFGNCLLIASQMPEARYVAGYQAWRELGRFVRKGEHGIQILVPYVYRKPTEPTAGADSEHEAEADSTYVRFGVGFVFDISQTDGEAITTWQHAIGNAETAVAGLARLEAYAESLGYTIARASEPGRVRGHCDHSAKRIVLDASLDMINQTSTLAHELAHAVLHEGITDYLANRGLYEVEAESVAYVVVTGLGLNADSCSLPYVASWSRSREDGDAGKAVRSLGERVHKAAAALLAEVERL